MKNQKLILSILLLCVFWKSYSQITPGTYTITTKLVNRNLDIKWADKNNGARLHIWDPNNGEAQKFIIENSNEAGYYTIKSTWGKCLTVNGNDPNILDMWDCINGNNQKWKITSTGDGYHNIQSKIGTYIDVRWAKRDNGSEVGMSGYSTWENNGAQRWKITGFEINTNSNNVIVGHLNNNKFPDIGIMKPSNDISNLEDGVTTVISKEKPKGSNRRKTNEEESNNKICWTENVNWETTDNWTFGEMDPVIYIGAIYKAQDIVRGNYKRMETNLNIKPKVALNVSSPGVKVDAILKGFNNVDGKNCVNDILGNIKSKNRSFRPAAQMKFNIEQIVEEKDIKLMLGVNYKGFGADIKSKFSANNSNKTQKYIARFSQSYFTASINDDFYKSKLVDDESLLIIDQVEFGAIGYVEIETSLSKEELDFVLNANYEGLGQSGGVEVGFYQKILKEKSKMKGYIYGGTLDRAVKVFEGSNVNTLNNWIKGIADFDFNTAFVPIAYKFKYLHNGDQSYLIQRSKYSRQVCVNSNFLNVKLKNIFMCETGKNHEFRADKPVAGVVYFSLWTTNREQKMYPIEIFPENDKTSEYFKYPSHSFIARNPSQENLSNSNDLNTIPENIRSYKIDFKKWANKEYLVKVDLNLGIEHQDGGFFASIKNGHWLRPGEGRIHEEFLIFDKIKNENGIFNLGPYTTPTDRNHDFWLQFQVITD